MESGNGQRKKQIDRIIDMEKRYDQALKVVHALDKAILNYSEFRQEIEKLIDYYDSGLWRNDFNADAQDLIPGNLKRGVLSEDGVFNLLADIAAVEQGIRKMYFSFNANMCSSDRCVHDSKDDILD